MNKKTTTIRLTTKAKNKLKAMAIYNGLDNSKMIEQLVLQKKFNESKEV